MHISMIKLFFISITLFLSLRVHGNNLFTTSLRDLLRSFCIYLSFNVKSPVLCQITWTLNPAGILQCMLLSFHSSTRIQFSLEFWRWIFHTTGVFYHFSYSHDCVEWNDCSSKRSNVVCEMLPVIHLFHDQFFLAYLIKCEFASVLTSLLKITIDYIKIITVIVKQKQEAGTKIA